MHPVTMCRSVVRAFALVCRRLALLTMTLLTMIFTLGLAHAQEQFAEELNESVVKLPVSISWGDEALQADMLVTIFKPSGPGPFPIAIINHGRNGEDRSTPLRFRMMLMSSYLVRQGFAVFVPTRLGYGGSAAIDPKTGAALDPESSGNCRDKDYAGALAPAVEEIAATVNFARQQSYTDPSRHLMIGQSVGGAATVAYAATMPPGLIGYVNFAGGQGGSPTTHPGVPCQPERMTRLYAQYGKTTYAPNLWIYTENDQYFAPRYTRAWHRAFAAGGSPTQFVLQVPFGEDGHRLLVDGLARWRPLMDSYLARVGFAVAPPPELATASGYAAIHEATRIPWLTSNAKATGYARFLKAPAPRAFAISETGQWGWASGREDPTGAALNYCNRLSPTPCVLYAIDDAVVLRVRAAKSAPDKTPALKQP